MYALSALYAEIQHECLSQLIADATVLWISYAVLSLAW